MVVAERQDAERHDLLREMRVRPLVRLALGQELEGGPRVIDLVEVHVARLIETEPTRAEHDERDQERHREIAPRGWAAEREDVGEPQPARRSFRGTLLRLAHGPPGDGRHFPEVEICLERRVAAPEAPRDVRRDAQHDQSDGDLAVAREQGLLEPLR